jgi:hypothetical protein
MHILRGELIKHLKAGKYMHRKVLLRVYLTIPGVFELLLWNDDLDLADLSCRNVISYPRFHGQGSE